MSALKEEYYQEVCMILQQMEYYDAGNIYPTTPSVEEQRLLGKAPHECAEHFDKLWSQPPDVNPKYKSNE